MSPFKVTVFRNKKLANFMGHFWLPDTPIGDDSHFSGIFSDYHVCSFGQQNCIFLSLLLCDTDISSWLIVVMNGLVFQSHTILSYFARGTIKRAINKHNDGF